MRPCLCALVVLSLSSTALADPVYFGTAARGGVNPEVVQKLRNSIDRALGQQGIKVLAISGVVEESAEKAERQAKSLLDDAAAAYTNEDWAGALVAANKALRLWENGPAFTTADSAWDLFRDIQSMRALVYLRLRKTRDAEDAIRAVLVAIPRWSPNRERAPPELIESYDAVVDELAATPATQLEVQSKPAGAKVIVDGKARGRAPLLIEEVAAGTHYVLRSPL